MRSLITKDAAAQLVHSLVTSRIDYCLSLLYGIPKCKTDNLQRILHVAARIVTCSSPEHITPVLKSLHWLPVKFRISFKILLMTNRPLRSGMQCRLEIPQTRLKSYGDRSFSFVGPTEWNKLPLEITQDWLRACKVENTACRAPQCIN